MNALEYDIAEDTGRGAVIGGVKWVSNGKWLARLEWVSGLSAAQRKILAGGGAWKWTSLGKSASNPEHATMAAMLKIPDDAVRYEPVALSIGWNPVLRPLLDESGAIAVMARSDWVGVFNGCECRGRPGDKLTPLWFLLGDEIQGVVMPIRFDPVYPDDAANLKKIARALKIMGIEA